MVSLPAPFPPPTAMIPPGSPSTARWVTTLLKSCWGDLVTLFLLMRCLLSVLNFSINENVNRNAISGAPGLRSWFGPNGQYIRELPCPSCRGRGYTPCTECGIERSSMDCLQCSGKFSLQNEGDDDVDNLDIKLDVKKSKRVYQSSPEVSLKITRSLKSLNAKTGLFTKRMKIIHQNPTLHAQRVAAIKIAKGTPTARKRASETQKAFFSDPENRWKRSVAMKGAKFYCSY